MSQSREIRILNIFCQRIRQIEGSFVFNEFFRLSILRDFFLQILYTKLVGTHFFLAGEHSLPTNPFSHFQVIIFSQPRVTKPSKCGKSRQATALKRTQVTENGYAWFASYPTVASSHPVPTTKRFESGPQPPKNVKMSCANMTTSSNALLGHPRPPPRPSKRLLVQKRQDPT